DFDPATSDINLLFVLTDLGFDRLTAMAGAFREASRSKPGGSKDRARYAPLVLTESQIRTSLDVFPLEFLDLHERRSLLAGEDVLAGLEIARHNLRHQCEYELRSKLVGLRQAYLRGGAEKGLAQSITVSAA